MDDAAKQPGPFDVRTVEALVALMTTHDLSEIALRDGVQRLRLRRGSAPVLLPASAAAPPPVAPAAVSSPTPAAPAAPPPAAGRKLLEIKSETVGTFYDRPKPESAPYVQVGTRVEPAKVVCLIEVMKTFNEIPAGVSGVVAEVLVQNQQYVEFGQVLFRVDPAG